MMIAGEASGDLHGAGVVRELKKRFPDADIFGIGGEKMKAEGMQLIFHVRELAFMGFVEVVKQLPLIRAVQKTLEILLRGRKPDVVVLIDYPGFNIRFAQVAHSHGIRIVYYISPQVWAWHKSRVKKMKGLIDKMLVVFPFEVDIYKSEGIDVEFVGHPLLEVLTEPQERKSFCTRYGLNEMKPIVGLIPGSRKQEIERIFPAMIGAARLLHREFGAQPVVGLAPTVELEYMESFLHNDVPMTFVRHATYDVMGNSDVALVTSGTATLEAACFKTPMVVVYKTSLMTYLIGRMLVKVNNIGLVNIVAGKRIVPELIQSRATPDRMAREAAKILHDEQLRKTMINELGVIRERLGTVGASKRVADTICAFATNN
jgi:lipid-A-disaccharide synthase